MNKKVSFFYHNKLYFLVNGIVTKETVHKYYVLSDNGYYYVVDRINNNFIRNVIDIRFKK